MTSELRARIPNGYRIDSLLGVVRMAHVFLATQAQSGRQVALKVAKQATLEDPVLLRLFEQELRSGQHLDHPNIVKVYGGEGAPQAFIAMEYLPRGSLHDRLVEKGMLALDDAVRVILETGEALAYAHRRGVVHQDVKPANIFLTEEGSAKLGDWGVAIMTGGLARGGPERSSGAGTPFYMSPEHFSGGDISAASDQYSLALLAYELLSGKRPFDGESYEELMAAHLSTYPKNLRYHREELPRALEHVMARALAKHPAQRFASVNEMLAAVRKAFGIAADSPESSVPPPPPPAKGRHAPETGAHPTAAARRIATGAHSKVEPSGAKPGEDQRKSRGLWPFGRKKG